MSIELVKSEILRFLASDVPEVLCVRGEWGVGKTYTWKKYLSDVAKTGNIPFDKYSYVSVYGLKDSAELKSSIYKNQTRILEIEKLVDQNSLAKSLGELYNSSKPYFSHIGEFFGSKGRAISSMADDLAFQSIRRQIVCFDDLERAGSELSTRDVMGLASFLKEERDCKVVLLLNDVGFDEKSKADFNLHFEKVVDSSLSFVPTTEEVVEIALDKSLKFKEKLEETVKASGLKNIRILKKIERLTSQVFREFDWRGDDDFVMQVVQTVTVATLVKLSGGDAASLADLRGYSSMTPTNVKDREGPDWLGDLLESVGYVATDTVDLVLIDGVEHGWVDYSALRVAFDETRAEKKVWNDSTPYSQAWKLYHNSLDVADAEIVNMMYEAVKDDPNSVSLLNFNSTVCLFRDLGFDEKADEIIAEYFARRDFDRNALDEDVFLFVEGPVDAKIEEHFANLKANYVDPRKPEDVLTGMFVTQGYNYADLELLSKLSPDELVKMFESLEFRNVSRGLKWALRFVDTEQYPPLGANLRAAFEILARRSGANRRKLEKLGFKSKGL